MSVYLCFSDVDWVALDEDAEDWDVSQEPPMLDSIQNWEGPIPRVGEFIYGGDQYRGYSWFEVLNVFYSSMKQTFPRFDGHPRAQEENTCWVDINVRRVEGNPRDT